MINLVKCVFDLTLPLLNGIVRSLDPYLLWLQPSPTQINWANDTLQSVLGFGCGRTLREMPGHRTLKAPTPPSANEILLLVLIW